ncbi:MAG: hypothetical protein ISR58_11610 [Anaerolineales bacterium]|nr:hypothetical protein [Chloroflexota bacterium]MBL6981822.1 hypothetical protein [Anaerolineales bacterium]
MKKMLGVVTLVMLFELILANSVWAGSNQVGTIDTGAPVRRSLPVPANLAPAPPGYDNIDSAVVTLSNTWTKVRVCFPLPSGWSNTIIRVWSPSTLTWNDILTQTEIIGGVKHRCADVLVNGTIALQGQRITGLVNPEISPCDRDPSNCPEPVLGCTDPSATNYDASADTDDGSCTYPPNNGQDEVPH